MKKEELKLDNIKHDLKTVLNFQILNVSDWRFSYIIPITLLAVMIGILLKNILAGLFIFSFAAYHIVRFFMEYKNYKAKKNAIEEAIARGDISISIERLSHIAVEVIYEPHFRLKHSHAAKEVTFFYFASGSSWRIPAVRTHYGWSKDYYTSTEGLKNISISGEEFFYISLQGNYDIAYIYPCDFFTIDGELKSKHDF